MPTIKQLLKKGHLLAKKRSAETHVEKPLGRFRKRIKGKSTPSMGVCVEIQPHPFSPSNPAARKLTKVRLMNGSEVLATISRAMEGVIHENSVVSIRNGQVKMLPEVYYNKAREKSAHTSGVAALTLRRAAEMEISHLEKQIPLHSAAATKAAFKQALGKGLEVLVSDDNGVYRTRPNGTRELVKKLPPKLSVPAGTKVRIV